jgi:hypothetical protein
MALQVVGLMFGVEFNDLDDKFSDYGGKSNQLC